MTDIFANGPQHPRTYTDKVTAVVVIRLYIIARANLKVLSGVSV